MAGPDTVATLGGLLLRLFRRQAGDRQLLGLWSLPADEAAVRLEFTGGPVEVAVPDEPPAPLGTIATVGTLLAATARGEFVQRQRAVRIVGGRVTDLFHELSVSCPAIEARLGLPVRHGTDAYLTRYVAAQFEQRLLRELAAAGLDRIAGLNINLPVSFTVTAGFTAIREAARRAGTLLGVEIALADALIDLPLFFAARDRVKGGGMHRGAGRCGPPYIAVVQPRRIIGRPAQAGMV